MLLPVFFMITCAYGMENNKKDHELNLPLPHQGNSKTSKSLKDANVPQAHHQDIGKTYIEQRTEKLRKRNLLCP